MTAKRTRTRARVALWLGGPVAVVLCLLVWGIHMGSAHRAAVRRWEWRFLDIGEAPVGYHSEAPNAASTRSDKAEVKAQGKGKASGAQSADSAARSASASSELGVWPQGAASGGAMPARPTAHSSTKVADGSQAAAALQDGSAAQMGSQPGSAVAGLDRLAVPIPVRVKLLVDDRWASDHPDWIQRTQRALQAAAEVYRSEFGIQLRATGAVLWSGPRTQQTLTGLFDDLRSHAREGADVVLGLVGQPLSAQGYAIGAPAAGSAYNGNYGLVGLGRPASRQGTVAPGPRDDRDGDSGTGFSRGMMRSLGHLFGALEVRDRQGQAFQLGTWMSDAPPPTGRGPWIDLDNRQRILAHKGLPFMPEAQ